MSTISPIASATAPNWLKEAQESLVAAQSSGGMLGTLQSARGSNHGSIKSFLATSQNNALGFALISQGQVQASRDLAFKAATDAYNKRIGERLAAAQARAAPQTNYTPPKTLESVIYFENGSTLDTVSNILTLSNGAQIDATTGLSYVDESAVIRMANGAYLDTKNNVLVLANGTRIDAISGLVITA